MKILDKISPKRFLRSGSKIRRSVSGSERASFSSGSDSSMSSDISSSSVHKPSKGATTPTSVIFSSEISPDWAETSRDLTLTSEAVQYELKQAFKLIDKDGDGKVTRQELASLLNRVGPCPPPSEDELFTMLGDLDSNGDGCISLEEFGAIASAFGPACVSELRDVFGFFDKDHDGRITAEELLLVFEAIGDDGCTIEDCRRMIDGVSKTGDGFVCFEDFTRLMEAPR